MLWTAPQAKVLMNSPAVQVIRWAQAQFPALLPGGVVDSHPLMAPPRAPEACRRRPAMTGTVEIRNVVKRFGKVEAVRDVSLQPCRKARRWRSSATTAPARPR